VGMGVILTHRKDPEGAIALFEQALGLHRELEDRSGEALCLFNLAGCHDKLGRRKQARELYERSLTIAEENKDLEGVARAGRLLAGALIRSGKWGASKRLTQRWVEAEMASRPAHERVDMDGFLGAVRWALMHLRERY
jgi:tetratricopeptide (TPR) repeat protein